MIYQIPFAYEMYGRIEVEAENLEKAYIEAERKLSALTVSEMAKNAEYLENSEGIDEEGLVLDENGNIIDD